VIVFPHPLGGVHLNLFKVGPVVLRQPFVSHRSIEPLDVGVLLRLAWLDVLELNAPLLGPGLDGRADVLRAVVTADHPGLTPPSDDLLEGSDHSF